ANQGARDYVKQKVYTKMALGVGAIGGIIALVWLLLRTPNSPTSAIISVKPLFYPEPPEMILNDDACKTAIDAYTAKNFPLAVAEFQKRLAVEKDETVLFYFIAASLADTTAVLSHKTLKTFDEQLDYLTKKQSLFAPNIPRLRATIALRLAIR
ncbi:MAG: hypothetical protein RI894_494, partial [Bacteroidota bacterium]